MSYLDIGLVTDIIKWVSKCYFATDVAAFTSVRENLCV